MPPPPSPHNLVIRSHRILNRRSASFGNILGSFFIVLVIAVVAAAAAVATAVVERFTRETSIADFLLGFPVEKLISRNNWDDSRPRSLVFRECDRSSTSKPLNGRRNFSEADRGTFLRCLAHGVTNDDSLPLPVIIIANVSDEHRESLMLGAIFSQRLRPSPHFALDRALLCREIKIITEISWSDRFEWRTVIHLVDRCVRIELQNFLACRFSELQYTSRSK